MTLRKIQSQLIASTADYWSLSNVLNIVSAGGIIASKKLDRSEWQKIKSTMKQKKLDFNEKMVREFIKKIA